MFAFATVLAANPVLALSRLAKRTDTRVGLHMFPPIARILPVNTPHLPTLHHHQHLGRCS